MNTVHELPVIPSHTRVGNDFLDAWRRDARRNIHNLCLRASQQAELTAEEAVIAAVFQRAQKYSLQLCAAAIERENVTQGSVRQCSSSGLQGIQGILIKPVSDACNLRCTYCYEGVGSQRYLAPQMSLKTLKHLMEEVFATPRGPIQFLWHGGEPLLADRRFYQEAVSLQKSLNRHGIEISNAVQTSGVLIDEHWARFFRHSGFSVGLSIDGPEDLHDSARRDSKGRGTFESIVKAIRILRSHDVSFGAISVIGESHCGRASDLLSSFRELGISSYDVHPNFGNDAIKLPPLSPKAYSDFVIDLFDCWLATGDVGIRILTFDDVFNVMLGEKPTACYYGGNCASVVAVEADGAVIPCTRPFNRAQYTFGNMSVTSLDSVVSSDKYEAFRSADLSAQSRSIECPWFEMCHNGCPQHRQQNGMPDVSGGSIYCQCQSDLQGGNAAIWEHLFSRVATILALNQEAPAGRSS